MGFGKTSFFFLLISMYILFFESFIFEFFCINIVFFINGFVFWGEVKLGSESRFGLLESKSFGFIVIYIDSMCF